LHSDHKDRLKLDDALLRMSQQVRAEPVGPEKSAANAPEKVAQQSEALHVVAQLRLARCLQRLRLLRLKISRVLLLVPDVLLLGMR
jgi:hypothetical protein